MAGSERIRNEQLECVAQNESIKINKSLTFLEQTMRALSEKSRFHIPFRQSKLTHLLQDSLGGKCETVMIGNIWGDPEHIEETLATLRFACRVMKVPIRPTVNLFHDPSHLCKQYLKEIDLLHKELAAYDTIASRSNISYLPLSDGEINEIRQQILKYINNDTEKIEFVNLRQMNEILTQFKEIVIQTESRVEKRLQEKYAPKEKKENHEKNIEQPNIVHEKSNLVGEKEGNSFSVGRPGTSIKSVAPTVIVNPKKKNKKVKENIETEHRLSPNSFLSPATEKIDTNNNNVAQDVPPSKTEAFEMFKRKPGEVLHTILNGNKDTLAAKKREARDVATTININLQEIEKIKVHLEALRNTNGEIFKDGLMVFNEEQFELLSKLHSLKKEYRVNYEHLQNLRADSIYCKNLVKKCRQKLLSEFETWYKESFGVIEQDPKVKKQASCLLAEDDQGVCFEKAEKALLMKSPESAAFYSARLETDRRKISRAFPYVKPK